MLAALILAAGESRRMGSPKALLPYQDKTFVEHLLEVTRHPRVSVQRVVLGASAAAIRERLHLAEGSVVVNDQWELGQLSSIQAGIRSLEDEPTDGAMICPVDHPLVSAPLVAMLIDEFDRTGAQRGIVLPVYRGKRGHPVIFARRFYDQLLAAPNDKGARAIVWQNPSEIREIETSEEGVVLNINDPDAYRKAVL
ncbi:MAG TPA: nucleotidyltransferase family protein [Candidatus Acidoferrales bacterium]|nr:nucleotidyltransferase family protein [Candidatus Acidoferrales bacterium]